MRRLGLIHSPPPPAAIRFGAALPVSLPTPKPSVDYHMACRGFDALGNTDAGNCVWAGLLHAAQIRMANAWSSAWRPTAAQALGLYARYTGYRPGDPATDQGTDPNVAYAAYVHDGLDLGLQVPDVAVRVVLDPRNLDHLRLAVEWFGSVSLCLDLPAAAETAQTWDMATWTGDRTPGSWGGHYVVSGRYDAAGFWAVTWGEEMLMRPDFLAAYALSADALLSRDWLHTTGISPAGLDFDALRARAQEIAA